MATVSQTKACRAAARLAETSTQLTYAALFWAVAGTISVFNDSSDFSILVPMAFACVAAVTASIFHVAATLMQVLGDPDED